MAITVNDNFQVNSPKGIDAKYSKFSGGTYQPWASSAEAISNIVSAYRYQYLTVLCLMNGDPIEYWWRIDTTDASLEPKNKESYTLNGTGTITLGAGYLYKTIVVLPTTTISNLQIGTTLGGTDIEPGAAVTGGTAYVLDYPTYTASSKTLYFTNPTSGTKILLYKTF